MTLICFILRLDSRRSAGPILLLFLPFLLFSAPELSAQFDDDLYIPPKITVGSSYAPDEAPTIEFEERFTPDWEALLPYLFFDNPGGYDIPERYRVHRSPAEVSEYVDTAGITSGRKYHELLDIIGYRLRRYDSATLQLRGAHSTEPGETPEIAQTRAEVVRDFLTTIWQVDPTRISILDPVRRCDTLDNNALQGEARRVEFASSDLRVLAPVSYPKIGYAAADINLTILLQTNMEPADVDSLEVRLLDDDEETVAFEATPGHPDSTTYTLLAEWYQSEPGDHHALQLVVRVRDRSGRYRASNIVTLPIRIRKYEADGYDKMPRWTHYTIPFGDPGDTTLDDAVRRDIVSAAARHRSLAAISSETPLDSFVPIARGAADMAEVPAREAPEVNIALEEQRRKSAEWEEERDRSLGRFRLMQKLYHGEMFYLVPLQETPEDEQQTNERQNEYRDRWEERKIRTDLLVADSLAYARGRIVIDYLVDSLGVPSAIDELTPLAMKAMTYQERGWMGGLEGDDIEALRLDDIELMKTGVAPTSHAGQYVWPMPEDRCYNRSVYLVVRSKEYYEWLPKAMFP